MCQGEVRIPTVSSVAALVAAPLYNWAFINALGLGLDGAAMAVNAVQVQTTNLQGAGPGSLKMLRWCRGRSSAAAAQHGLQLRRPPARVLPALRCRRPLR